MMDDMEDPIDALLREGFEGPAPEDGFSDRVMDHLPTRKQSRHWPLHLGLGGGVVAGGSTLWHASIAQVGWSHWVAGELSASTVSLFVAAAGLAIGALAWSISETDDRSVMQVARGNTA